MSNASRPDEDDDLLPELPELLGDAEGEEPFEPDDDADFGMHLDEGEQLSPDDLEAGLGETGDTEEAGQVGDEGESEDWLSGGEADERADLDDDDTLVGGEEDGWLEGGEPPEETEQFDDDEIGGFGGEGGGDDGEDGFADDEHDLAFGGGPLPPLTGSADDQEGLEEGADAAFDVGFNESEEDEDPDGGDLEMWPGVRFRFVPRARVAILGDLRAPMASGYYAAAGDRLYALRDGTLHVLGQDGFRALGARPERARWVAIAAGGGALWAASADAVFRCVGPGYDFEEVYHAANVSTAHPQLQATADGSAWLCRDQRMYRIDGDSARLTPLDTDRPVSLWAAGGECSLVVQGASGPILWSRDGGRRFGELALPAEGLTDLWVTDGMVAVATTQGVLASSGGDWLQLLPPSTTLGALSLGPDGPQVFGCAVHPGGWALVTRLCRDASLRPRIVEELPADLGAPLFLAAQRTADGTVLHVVAEQGVRSLVVRDA